jgi:outer membrane immunogenic protein
VDIRKILLAAAVAAPTISGGAALAADLPQPYVAPPAAAAPTWEGLYIGAVGAYGWGNTAANFSAPGGITNWGANQIPLSGGLLGLTLGYNFDLHNAWVLGIEGDISAGNLGGSSFLAATGGSTSDPGYVPDDTQGVYRQSYFGTLRGRIGWSTNSMGPTLWYLTGGLAFSDGRREITNVNVGDSVATATHTGWTIGGGIEHKITNNWSIKGELLYADLGTGHYNGNLGVVTDVHLTDTLFRVGVNYKF